jgi:hypothetical protein
MLLPLPIIDQMCLFSTKTLTQLMKKHSKKEHNVIFDAVMSVPASVCNIESLVLKKEGESHTQAVEMKF